MFVGRELSRLVLCGVALALIALGATGCSTVGAADPEVETVELKTYAVPPGYGSEVRSILRQAFANEDLGSVSLGPSGKLVVVAPASIHRGVGEFMQELSQLDTPSALTPVTLSYWIVLGESTKRGKAGEWSAAGDKSLDAIADALEQISHSQGAQRFELLERVQLTSIGEETASITGLLTHLEQRATIVGSDVVAKLLIAVQQHRLGTQVKLKPDQVAVLGQTGIADVWGGSMEIALEDPDTLYYVISSSLE